MSVRGRQIPADQLTARRLASPHWEQVAGQWHRVCSDCGRLLLFGPDSWYMKPGTTDVPRSSRCKECHKLRTQENTKARRAQAKAMAMGPA